MSYLLDALKKQGVADEQPPTFGETKPKEDSITSVEPEGVADMPNMFE